MELEKKTKQASSGVFKHWKSALSNTLLITEDGDELHLWNDRRIIMFRNQTKTGRVKYFLNAFWTKLSRKASPLEDI